MLVVIAGLASFFVDDEQDHEDEERSAHRDLDRLVMDLTIALRTTKSPAQDDNSQNTPYLDDNIIQRKKRSQ